MLSDLWPGLDIRHLAAFSAVAKTGSFARAAEMLGYTQPAVSQQVARDMARGVRHKAKADFGLAVTGIAGPGGGTEEKPVGLVYIALADDAHTEHKKLMIPGDRELIRWRTSQAALDMLRRRLI